MDLHGDIARFLGHDQACLVAASLACPVCLSGDVAWRLDLTTWEPRADCACRSCGHERHLFLSQDQALRLALHVNRPLDPTPRPEPGLVAL